ncbi:MAG: TPM domain-containing protein [Schleiferiaceae bacterium]|nr:TPM domain-containing protein [Schleiferiaceae bacterium]
MKILLQESDKEVLQAAIQAAEKNCSGEIRVHVAETCTRDPLVEARYWFKQLGMHKTALRNGILFYIALDSRKFSILGDQGIHEKVGQAFWDQVRDAMLPYLQNEDWLGGLSSGISEAGKALAIYFPHAGATDINELSDEISHSS